MSDLTDSGLELMTSCTDSVVLNHFLNQPAIIENIFSNLICHLFNCFCLDNGNGAKGSESPTPVATITPAEPVVESTENNVKRLVKNPFKSSLYSRYYTEACNEWRGSSPWLSA